METCAHAACTDQSDEVSFRFCIGICTNSPRTRLARWSTYHGTSFANVAQDHLTSTWQINPENHLRAAPALDATSSLASGSRDPPLNRMLPKIWRTGLSCSRLHVPTYVLDGSSLWEKHGGCLKRRVFLKPRVRVQISCFAKWWVIMGLTNTPVFSRSKPKIRLRNPMLWLSSSQLKLPGNNRSPFHRDLQVVMYIYLVKIQGVKIISELLCTRLMITIKGW